MERKWRGTRKRRERGRSAPIKKRTPRRAVSLCRRTPPQSARLRLSTSRLRVQLLVGFQVLLHRAKKHALRVQLAVLRDLRFVDDPEAVALEHLRAAAILEHDHLAV